METTTNATTTAAAPTTATTTTEAEAGDAKRPKTDVNSSRVYHFTTNATRTVQQLLLRGQSRL